MKRVLDQKLELYKNALRQGRSILLVTGLLCFQEFHLCPPLSTHQPKHAITAVSLYARECVPAWPGIENFNPGA